MTAAREVCVCVCVLCACVRKIRFFISGLIFFFIFAFKFGEVNVINHAVAHGKFNQCQTTKNVLVGHLNTEGSLGSYLFDCALDVNSTTGL